MSMHELSLKSIYLSIYPQPPSISSIEIYMLQNNCHSLTVYSHLTVLIGPFDE